MSYLSLVRHGQSEWNLENRFTGWVDLDLSEKVFLIISSNESFSNSVSLIKLLRLVM